MCQFKSGIIMKDSVYIGDFDSHTDMLEYLKIEDIQKNAETKVIRAELIPKNNDVFSDIETWEYKVDQDIVPDWYIPNYDKERMIQAVKEWAKEHIHVGKSYFKIIGSIHYLKDCKNVEACNNSTVEAWDNSTVVIPNYSSNKRDNIILI